MAVVTSVPLNTMLADLDESLRALLKRELGRHGFDGSRSSSTPRRRSGRPRSRADGQPLPLRPARGGRPPAIEWREQRGNGAGARGAPAAARRGLLRGHGVDARGRGRAPPALAGARRCSTRYPILPGDVLAGTLANGASATRSTRKTAQARAEDKADFWTVDRRPVQGVASTTSCTLSCEPGTLLRARPRGAHADRARPDPAARRGDDRGVPPHRRRRRATPDGEPVANAWVALPTPARWAASDPDGRFRFDRCSRAATRCLARTADGAEAKGRSRCPARASSSWSARRPRRAEAIEPLGHGRLPQWLPPRSLDPRRAEAES